MTTKTKHTRPIVVTFNRKGAAPQLRYYSRLTTAIPRAVCVLMEQAQPGDVAELASNEFGYQIGFVRIHAGGRISVKFDRGVVSDGT